MIDYKAIREELNRILQYERMNKSFWNKTTSDKTPVKKEVTRKDGTTFMQTFYTKIKNLFSKPTSDKPTPLYPGSFATIEDAEAVLGKPYEDGALEEWYDQIRPASKHAIKQYSGYWYSDINGVERGSILKSDLDSRTYSQIRQYSQLIEQALNKYELKQDVVLHRQVGEHMLSLFQRAFKSPDKLFIDDGFFSTTAVKNSVRRHNSIDLVIKVPKGKGRGAYIKYLSDHPFENEFLINSHSVFTVDNVSQVNGRWQVELSWKNHMEVI